MGNDFRAQVAVWHDSLASTDACVINPTFRSTGLVEPDYQSLATELATAVDAKFGSRTQIRVRLYKLPLVKPISPAAEAVKNATLVINSAGNRDVALCLSFYASQNVKRQRGRLYIPPFWRALDTNKTRPLTADMNDILNWRLVFEGLGGVDCDWTVWSDKDGRSRPVTNVYVDNEWDTIRSRGLKATARVQASTSEANLPNFVRLAAPAGGDELESPAAA